MKLNASVIGAGISGVSAACSLLSKGCSVTLYEKSRGFGGRCASKRREGHVIDHGAQYFTLRDSRFSEAVREAAGEAILKLDAPILNRNTGEVLADTGRFFHREGNSRLARDLGKKISMIPNTPIEDGRALLRKEGGDFDCVVSTAPWPQTAQLFGVSSTWDYVPCLTVLLDYQAEWPGRTREYYAISDRSSALQWSACENHKPGRIAAGSTVLVAQMSETFSRKFLESPLEELPDRVRPLVEETWELPSNAFSKSLAHRWRFARVHHPMPPVELPRGLFFAGDALTGSRVEDAWLAGSTIAGQISDQFLISR